jgi:hypothetical protein
MRTACPEDGCSMAENISHGDTDRNQLAKKKLTQEIQPTSLLEIHTTTTFTILLQ